MTLPKIGPLILLCDVVEYLYSVGRCIIVIGVMETEQSIGRSEVQAGLGGVGKRRERT